MIIGIVAVARNFAVGKDGKLPWHHAADLKFFKQTTTNHAVVMGFNTWQSIGKPLPKRLNIVLSRTRNIESQPNVLLMRNKEEVLALSKYLNGDLFVIGGAETYRNFADAIEKWIVTEIPETIEDADVFMPEGFLNDFEVVEKKHMEANLVVKIYERKIKAVDEDLRRELLAMREADLTTRERLAKTGGLFDGYNREMEAVHLKNARRLEELIDEHGWLGISKVGADGADAAWLVAQHAISLPEFSKKVLKLLLEAEKTGDVPPRYAAYLADRIAFYENRPQRYGTQADWNENGEMEIWTLEDEEKVNEYRAAVGLKPLESKILESEEFEKNAPKDWHERRSVFEEWTRKVGWRK